MWTSQLGVNERLTTDAKGSTPTVLLTLAVRASQRRGCRKARQEPYTNVVAQGLWRPIGFACGLQGIQIGGPA